MKPKYIQAIIFLILLVLTFISQLKVAFPVVPGWHSVVYPPKYLIEMSIIILSLTLAIAGYTFLSFIKRQLNSRIFGLHFLLTVPKIIALIYPFKPVDITSLSTEEIVKMFSQSEWKECAIISVFLVGQLIFLIFFAKHARQNPRVQ